MLVFLHIEMMHLWVQAGQSDSPAHFDLKWQCWHNNLHGVLLPLNFCEPLITLNFYFQIFLFFCNAESKNTALRTDICISCMSRQWVSKDTQNGRTLVAAAGLSAGPLQQGVAALNKQRSCTSQTLSLLSFDFLISCGYKHCKRRSHCPGLVTVTFVLYHIHACDKC